MGLYFQVTFELLLLKIQISTRSNILSVKISRSKLSRSKISSDKIFRWTLFASLGQTFVNFIGKYAKFYCLKIFRWAQVSSLGQTFINFVEKYAKFYCFKKMFEQIFHQIKFLVTCEKFHHFCLSTFCLIRYTSSFEQSWFHQRCDFFRTYT